MASKWGALFITDMWVSLKGKLAGGESQDLSSYEKLFFPSITATLVTPIPDGSLDSCSQLPEAVSIVLCVTWCYDLDPTTKRSRSVADSSLPWINKHFRGPKYTLMLTACQQQQYALASLLTKLSEYEKPLLVVELDARNQVIQNFIRWSGELKDGEWKKISSLNGMVCFRTCNLVECFVRWGVKELYLCYNSKC